MDKIRWGLMSTARINNQLIPAICNSSRGELLAVASRRMIRARKYARQKQIRMAFGSYDEMLASPDVDVVYVSLPNHMHAEWTIKALQAGKHVLCEKPLALSEEEVDAVLLASKETGKHVMEALMYRHHPQSLMIEKWVEEGRIGEIQSIRGVFNFVLDHPGDYRYEPEMGGGAIWDIGIYPISFAQWLMKEPAQRVFGMQRTGKNGVDMVFHGEMVFSEGRFAQISCSFQSPSHTSVEIMGAKGRILVTRPFVNMGHGEVIQIFDEYGKLSKYESTESDLYKYEVENLHSAILDGKAPRISLQDSWNHIHTIRSLLESAKTNSVIELA
jgi:D-xylose 1-dehydrogenase (NADP+, D-xylono-1,5-lactone-forming)